MTIPNWLIPIALFCACMIYSYTNGKTIDGIYFQNLAIINLIIAYEMRR